MYLIHMDKEKIIQQLIIKMIQKIKMIKLQLLQEDMFIHPLQIQKMKTKIKIKKI